MIAEKKCLMLGLPNAGKSTYLAAFWAIEKDGKTGHKLSCYQYPEDFSYLDVIKGQWMRQELVNRTASTAPIDIKLSLVENATDKKIELSIPDFKGELFQTVIENNEPESVREWIECSDGFLFFMEDIPELPLQEEVGPIVKGDNKPRQLTIDKMSPWIKNIVLLKYLSKKTHKDVPLAICFSAWDSVEKTAPVEDVEEWVKTEHKFFYNFVNYHYSNVKYFGISAQGRKYSNDDTNEIIEECQQLTELKERAYVYTNKKSNDITEPIAFLINY